MYTHAHMHTSELTTDVNVLTLQLKDADWLNGLKNTVYLLLGLGLQPRSFLGLPAEERGRRKGRDGGWGGRREEGRGDKPLECASVTGGHKVPRRTGPSFSEALCHFSPWPRLTGGVFRDG